MSQGGLLYTRLGLLPQIVSQALMGWPRKSQNSYLFETQITALTLTAKKKSLWLSGDEPISPGAIVYLSLQLFPESLSGSLLSLRAREVLSLLSPPNSNYHEMVKDRLQGDSFPLTTVYSSCLTFVVVPWVPELLTPAMSARTPDSCSESHDFPNRAGQTFCTPHSPPDWWGLDGTTTSPLPPSTLL